MQTVSSLAAGKGARPAAAEGCLQARGPRQRAATRCEVHEPGGQQEAGLRTGSKQAPGEQASGPRSKVGRSAVQHRTTVRVTQGAGWSHARHGTGHMTHATTAKEGAAARPLVAPLTHAHTHARAPGPARVNRVAATYTLLGNEIAKTLCRVGCVLQQHQALASLVDYGTLTRACKAGKARQAGSNHPDRWRSGAAQAGRGRPTWAEQTAVPGAEHRRHLGQSQDATRRGAKGGGRRRPWSRLCCTPAPTRRSSMLLLLTLGHACCRAHQD